jgi:hypothetical protein
MAYGEGQSESRPLRLHVRTSPKRLTRMTTLQQLKRCRPANKKNPRPAVPPRVHSSSN